MRLERLAIENFLTFGDRQVLPLTRRGFTLVEGENLDDSSASSNGAGKSALPDALTWCLYGKTARGSKGDDVVNRFVGHDCSVEVKFSDGSTKYRLTRYRKHRKMKDALELITDAGVRLTGASKEETQEKVNDLVGLDYKTFVALLCGQGVVQPFSAMTDAQAQEVMERLAGTGLYTSAGELARREAGRITRDLDDYEHRADDLESRIGSKKTAIRDLRARIKGEDADVEAEKKARGRDLERLRKELAELEKELRTSRVAAKSIAAYEQAERTAQAGLQAAISAQAVAEQAERSTHDELLELRAHQKQAGGTCDRCGGVIDARSVGRLVGEAEEKLAEAARKVINAAKAKQTAEDFVAEARSKLKAARGLGVGSVVSIERQIKSKATEVKREEAALARVGAKDSNLEDLLSEALEERQKLEEKLEEVRARVKELALDQAALDFWSRGFGNKGLKSLVLDSQLPFLNRCARKFSRIMTDGNLSVDFRTTSTLKSGETTDHFGVDVTNKYGGEGYQANSYGERRKVDIVVSLSFLALVASRAKAALNCIWLDEVFDGLDAEGLERALSIITDELGGYESVFVITHRTDLKDFFSHQITVRKKNKQSTIET